MMSKLCKICNIEFYDYIVIVLRIMYFLMFLYVRNYNKKVSVLLIELSVEHVYKRALTNINNKNAISFL